MKHLGTWYNKLVRAVKRNTRMAKRNYVMKVAREAKRNPKGFLIYIEQKLGKE